MLFYDKGISKGINVEMARKICKDRTKRCTLYCNCIYYINNINTYVFQVEIFTMDLFLLVTPIRGSDSSDYHNIILQKIKIKVNRRLVY